MGATLEANIKLLDDDDLRKIGEAFAMKFAELLVTKPIQDTLVKALVRANRIAAREGLVAGYRPPPPEVVEDAPAPPIEEVKPPPAEPEPAAAQPEEARPEPARETTTTVPFPVSKKTKAGTERRRREARLARNVCRVVTEKPSGFVTKDELYNILGDTPAVRIALNQWVLNGEVNAVIWRTNTLKPTKGLQGRLMLDKAQTLARNKRREENRAVVPILRRRTARR